ncbi:MAG TPA: response regulator [Anaerolineales bacterium]|nr:response regulator [Anaerolineales bacterium]
MKATIRALTLSVNLPNRSLQRLCWIVINYLSELFTVMDVVAGNQSGTEEMPHARILVVDDDTLNQRMMQILLTRDGYAVDVVSSGQEALEAVTRRQYNLVFMDLQMPAMDGLETSRRIRQWENGGQHAYIVALTASYLPERGQELFEAGIDNYVAKPFDLEHIRRILKYVVNASVPDPVDSKSSNKALVPEMVLDVQRGIGQVGGDLEAYRELLGDFIEGLPERLRAIQVAFAAQDLATVSRAAHNLNGIAASLGALQLSEYARQLDKQSVDGYTEAIRHLIGEIQETGIKLIETSQVFLSGDRLGIRSL